MMPGKSQNLMRGSIETKRPDPIPKKQLFENRELRYSIKTGFNVNCKQECDSIWIQTL